MTITVKKADTATANKVCDQAKQGKNFQLKIKGNKKQSLNLLEKINKKIRKVNGWDLEVKTKKGKQLANRTVRLSGGIPAPPERIQAPVPAK